MHTPPQRIGEVAAQAQVHAVVASHLTPAVERNVEEVRRGIAEQFAGEVLFAHDCLRVKVE